jgi:hypothetical protein
MPPVFTGLCPCGASRHEGENCVHPGCRWKLENLVDANKELEASFDLHWEADMRAIKKWQDETGKTLVWPDHADLYVWMMKQLDALGVLETK